MGEMELLSTRIYIYIFIIINHERKKRTIKV